MIELIEYYWDEQTGNSNLTYENTYTGELSSKTLYHPLKKPEPDREKYFSELVVYLKTQDPYGPPVRGEHY